MFDKIRIERLPIYGEVHNRLQMVFILFQNRGVATQYPNVINKKNQPGFRPFNKLLQAINAVDISAKPRHIYLPIGIMRIARIVDAKMMNLVLVFYTVENTMQHSGKTGWCRRISYDQYRYALADRFLLSYHIQTLGSIKTSN